MSSLPPPTSVPNCGCGHKDPQNQTCPYAYPNTCGGPNYCGYCRANNPPANPLPPPPPMPLQMDTSALGTWRGVLIEPEEGEADSGKPQESGE